MGRKKGTQKMPACAYGAACTRKDCVYTHPPRPKGGKKAVVEKSEKVCLAYLAGVCPYGFQCWDQHPTDEDEINRLLNEFASKQCHFGLNCRNAGCLYRHPVSEPTTIYDDDDNQPWEYQESESESLQAVEEGYVKNGTDDPVITNRMKYRELLSSFFTSINELSMISKIDAMLDRFETREESLFDSLSSKYGRPVYDKTQSLENELDQIELRLKNLTVSSSSSCTTTQAQLSMSSLPAPFNPNETRLASQPFPLKPTTAPNPPIPAPERWKKAPHLLNQAETSSSSVHGTSRKPVPIPASLWTFDVSRDATAFSQHADPIARFYAVNYSMVNQTEASSSSSSPPQKSYQTGILDLHFQSTRTVYIVLDTLLDSELLAISKASASSLIQAPQVKMNGRSNVHGATTLGNDNERAVWLITGTGHHTGNTHVKAGALFDAVQQYLGEGGYDYALGKDGSGRNGAFAVFGKLYWK